LQINLPILELVSSCQNLLIAGMGSGFDLFCGFTIYINLTDLQMTAGEYTVAAAKHGLATGLGDTPSVGIGGLTVGGGIGYLVRKYGLCGRNQQPGSNGA